MAITMFVNSISKNLQNNSTKYSVLSNSEIVPYQRKSSSIELLFVLSGFDLWDQFLHLNQPVFETFSLISPS